MNAIFSAFTQRMQAMHEVIRPIHIPERPRTGITDEREVFAKMQEVERQHRKQARRARLLSALRFRRKHR